MEKKNIKERLKKEDSIDSEVDFRDQKPCCKNPDIEVVNGFWTCRNCGTVYTRELLATEKRMFTKEDVVKKKTHEPVSVRDSYRARTILTPSERDAVGGKIDKKAQLRFLEMKKSQRLISKEKEKSNLKIYNLLQNMVKKIYLPDYVRDIAWEIYLIVNKKGIDRGRSIDLIVSSCIYAAVRALNHPCLLEEIIEIGDIFDFDFSPNPKKRVLNVVRDIKEKVFKELDLTFYTINPKDLIFYFGEQLRCDIKIQTHALKILEYSLNKYQKLAGKRPKTLAAASLYLSLNNPEIKKDLIEIARISKDVLNKTVNIIKKVVYLIEDDSNIINLVRSILEDIPVIELIVEQEQNKAIELIKIDNPNLVILGVACSKVDSIKISSKLRQDGKLMKMPIFVIRSFREQKAFSDSEIAYFNGVFILPKETKSFRRSVEKLIK